MVTVAAIRAASARYGRGHHDAIAATKIVHFAACLNYYAYGFMAEYRAWSHPRHRASHQMQISPANGAGANFNDRISRVLDLRLRNLIEPNIINVMKDNRLHGATPFSQMIGLQSKKTPGIKNFKCKPYADF
jgi:hypothetical protein